MDEKNLKAAFGFNEDDEPEAEAQEELMEPSETDSEEARDDEPAEEEETSEEEKEETPALQPEEISRAADEARRQAEEQLKTIAEEKAKNDKSIDVLMKALKNFGYEGTPEEIADMLEANRTGKTADDIRSERLIAEEELNRMIEEHPVVKEAKRLNEEAIENRNRQMFEMELRNIQKINPEIKTLQDLQNLGENQEAFNAMIRGGLHIDAAYRVIAGNKQPKQAAKDTKSHIKTVNGSGTAGNSVIVPREERELIKEMIPDISDKEIDAWYKKKRG